MSTMEQVIENLKTAENGNVHTLTDNELNLFDKVKEIYNERIHVPCTPAIIACPVKMEWIFH